ncbi:hypothetical protein [Sphingomonas sp. BK069]|uniref:hypothetical protein n=1 Tax=Sphingomonas sp. BK069 TaxID=2586979 RepID=UPI001819ED97|nr:hypothetical protein [Sphingomonas sp. BK069]MBB3348154.1 hypothetical protein [Sphingomonas sp. BK069]
MRARRRAARPTIIDMADRPSRGAGRMIVAALAALALSGTAFAAPQASSARKQATAKAGASKPTAKKPARKGAKVAKPVAVPVEPPPVMPRSENAERLIAWVGAAHDNGKLPYAVIDKPAATLYLFAANGDFLGETPVLLGVGIGDDSTPGVGAKNLDDIGPAERTTPAGRFVTKFGRAFGRQRVLWVDYANAVAMHVVTSLHKNEHRVERLLSPSPEDNRISFGCINVGARFYNGKLRPQFEKRGGIVYITPDVKPLDEIFPRVRLLPYLAAAGDATGAGAAR